MQSYTELMTSDGIATLTDEAALDQIAQLIDLSNEPTRAAGTDRALGWCDELAQRGISPIQSTLLDYFRANAWANRQPKGRPNRAAVWSWEQPELQQQIFFLRRARSSPGFQDLDKLRQCQIFTNLANQLDTAGRFVEALESWTSALAIEPRFWMARGNRGRALWRYAASVYDAGHRNVLALFAHRHLEAATTPQPKDERFGHPEARASHDLTKKEIEKAVDLARIAASFELDGHSMGRSERERQYRQWCLSNDLFLNPLNDLGAHSIAARDILSLPDFVTDLTEPPVLIGYFNQLVQEFVSSRWNLYEGTRTTSTHFSDRNVRIYNTLDYPAYGLAVEKVRTAYRTAYSIFDKIAYFLDYYMKLGIDPKPIYFRTVWREKNGAVVHPIRPEFEQSENWQFRGLFWLSKDLFDETFADVTEPDAKALHELRIHLEHKYVKVHEMLVRSRDPDAPPDPFVDSLAYSIRRTELQDKTLRLLKLVRAALIYLSLVH